MEADGGAKVPPPGREQTAVLAQAPDLGGTFPTGKMHLERRSAPKDEIEGGSLASRMPRLDFLGPLRSGGRDVKSFP